MPSISRGTSITRAHKQHLNVDLSFLAVQDSSIGDLVTHSVSHLLISATFETFERLLRDTTVTLQ